MKKNKLIGAFLTLYFFVCSCENKSEKDDFIEYEKNGVLRIDISKLEKSGVKLKGVHFVNGAEIKQGINLDSTFRLTRVYSMKENKPEEKQYMNNWIALDYDGNLDMGNSYFYEAVLYKKNENQLFAEIHFQGSQYMDGHPYVLYGDVRSDFSINGLLDTVYFDNDVATFPLLNTKSGRNEKRFILVDESSKDTKGKKKQRHIFGTLRFDN